MSERDDTLGGDPRSTRLACTRAAIAAMCKGSTRSPGLMAAAATAEIKANATAVHRMPLATATPCSRGSLVPFEPLGAACGA
eukprot:scaffold120550_cov28-Tisochrysis_lutea.AAC.8